MYRLYGDRRACDTSEESSACYFQNGASRQPAGRRALTMRGAFNAPRAGSSDRTQRFQFFSGTIARALCRDVDRCEEDRRIETKFRAFGLHLLRDPDSCVIIDSVSDPSSVEAK